MGQAPDDNAEGSARADSHGQEVELWWGGYAGRTMLPAFTLCALLTIAILLVAHLVWQEESISAAVISHCAMYTVVLIWTAGLLRWAYRTVTIGYRLTTRRLLCEAGFRHPARPAIALEHIATVRVEQRRWERWAGIGRLYIVIDGSPTEVLHGVYHPEQVAAEVLRHVAALRRTGKPT